MRVQAEGSGPALVLLHGWAMTPRVWSGVVSDLAREFRIYSVELDWSVDGTPEEMQRAMATLDVSGATVCGWSLGGQLALQWALSQPRAVARLVLIGTTPRFVNAADWSHGMDDAIFDSFLRDFATDPAATVQRFALLQARGDRRAKDVARRLRENVAAVRENNSALVAGLEQLRDTDLRARLVRVPQPALVIHGECDNVVPVAAGAYLARELDDARLDVVAGAAHAPHVSAPAAVAASIRAFCHG